jgi:hypothetical protein
LTDLVCERKNVKNGARCLSKRTAFKAIGLLLGAAAVGVASGSAIEGSPHDFSTKGWSGGLTCVVCHTPHGGDATMANAPLWNHQVNIKLYKLYSSGTLHAGTLSQPAGVSKMCLSCHDGTVALDSFGGRGRTSATLGSRAIGVDAEGNLANDHPISFTYDSTLANLDGALFDPVTKMVEIGAGGAKTTFGTIANVMLFNGKIECASCHDVHNGFTANGGTGLGRPLLRVTRGGSSICLTCHNK